MELRDLTRVNLKECTHKEESDVRNAVADLFQYHEAGEEQKQAFVEVRDSLSMSYLKLLEVVPSGPARTRALNAITDARMLANQAITFKGQI